MSSPRCTLDRLLATRPEAAVPGRILALYCTIPNSETQKESYCSYLRFWRNFVLDAVEAGLLSNDGSTLFVDDIERIEEKLIFEGRRPRFLRIALCDLVQTGELVRPIPAPGKNAVYQPYQIARSLASVAFAPVRWTWNMLSTQNGFALSVGEGTFTVASLLKRYSKDALEKFRRNREHPLDYVLTLRNCLEILANETPGVSYRDAELILSHFIARGDATYALINDVEFVKFKSGAEKPWVFSLYTAPQITPTDSGYIRVCAALSLIGSQIKNLEIKSERCVSEIKSRPKSAKAIAIKYLARKKWIDERIRRLLDMEDNLLQVQNSIRSACDSHLVLAALKDGSQVLRNLLPNADEASDIISLTRDVLQDMNEAEEALADPISGSDISDVELEAELEKLIQSQGSTAQVDIPLPSDDPTVRVATVAQDSSSIFEKALEQLPDVSKLPLPESADELTDAENAILEELEKRMGRIQISAS